MSLDAPKSDVELLRLHAQRTRGGIVNGVAVGPASPLLPQPAPRKQQVSRADEEHDIQVAFFANVNNVDEQRRRPALALVHAVPNGGARSKRTAARLKAEGVKPGVLDVDCPVARGGYFGLRLELKRPGGALSPAQIDWIHLFEKEGHLVLVHDDAMAAWADLIAYLDQPRTETR